MHRIMHDVHRYCLSYLHLIDFIEQLCKRLNAIVLNGLGITRRISFMKHVDKQIVKP